MRTFTLTSNDDAVQFETSNNQNTVLVSWWEDGHIVAHNPHMRKKEARELYAELRAYGWKKTDYTY